MGRRVISVSIFTLIATAAALPFTASNSPCNSAIRFCIFATCERISSSCLCNSTFAA